MRAVARDPAAAVKSRSHHALDGLASSSSSMLYLSNQSKLFRKTAIRTGSSRSREA